MRKLEWRNDKSENPLMKIYIGDFGLSIIKWPPNVPKFEIPHAIHWAYRVDPAKAEETVEYIKSQGIQIEGPVGHKREIGILNWFFLDPDNYRVEIEARFATKEEADAVMERGKAGRQEHHGPLWRRQGAGNAEGRRLTGRHWSQIRERARGRRITQAASKDDIIIQGVWRCGGLSGP